MSRFGLKLMCELRDPRTLVRQAQAAEDAGFEFVAISDHFHPWLPEHSHSPFAWSVLGAVAAKTERLDLATGVTCPIMRYHPAIVAQAAATVACLTDRQFTLGIGSGERLNEHVTGSHFPAIDLRHEMLTEAIQVMRLLWSGKWTTFRGRYFTAEDARIYDLPDKPIHLVVAISGDESLRVAEQSSADGIMTVEPLPDLVQQWTQNNGGPAGTWAETTFCWAPTKEEGLRLAHERFRFAVPGWKVMAELPNPVNFAAACSAVTPEEVGKMIPHGPDPEPYVAALQSYLDAGLENISIVPAGDDLAGFIEFWTNEVVTAFG
ncbi:MAG TPA: TIGR03557 family F420-dependent LLM class oxidoreductase [Actinomycetota bacterium]|nr:TIGR03557 family F420-dependent LLM class oxidoreductase [Actinomycetota bacterium]